MLYPKCSGFKKIISFIDDRQLVQKILKSADQAQTNSASQCGTSAFGGARQLKPFHISFVYHNRIDGRGIADIMFER